MDPIDFHRFFFFRSTEQRPVWNEIRVSKWLHHFHFGTNILSIPTFNWTKVARFDSYGLTFTQILYKPSSCRFICVVIPWGSVNIVLCWKAACPDKRSDRLIRDPGVPVHLLTHSWNSNNHFHGNPWPGLFRWSKYWLERLLPCCFSLSGCVWESDLDCVCRVYCTFRVWLPVDACCLVGFSCSWKGCDQVWAGSAHTCCIVNSVQWFTEVTIKGKHEEEEEERRYVNMEPELYPLCLLYFYVIYILYKFNHVCALKSICKIASFLL